jgi:hypothetical protein
MIFNVKIIQIYFFGLLWLFFGFFFDLDFYFFNRLISIKAKADINELL